jgi:hypothetical protein
MIKEDFFTGEVLTGTSPPISPFTSEREAVENAGFGKYDYDPGSRMMNQQYYPGGYGYNQQNYMTPPYGLGSNPYQQQYYGSPNPAISFTNQQTQNQQTQEIKGYIQPVNLSGSEYLPSTDFEDKIEELKLYYWGKEQEQQAESSIKNFNSGFGNSYNTGYGFNYYGVPYYNPYQYNSIVGEVNQKITDIKNEARENRIQFNINLSRLAHNFAGDNYNDSVLQEVYRGKEVDVPGWNNMTTQDLYNYNRFNNMVPFDNSQVYREHSVAVSREFNNIISKDSNMQECFENMGVLGAHYALEEEKHRRRDGTVLYNSEDNSYKYFVRSKAAERYAEKNGYSKYNNTTYNKPDINQFPTLSQSAKLCDDGTLNITCRFGSKAGQVYSVHNSEEAGYEANKARFQSFIDSIPGSIYNPSNNSGGGS